MKPIELDDLTVQDWVDGAEVVDHAWSEREANLRVVNYKSNK